jgi:hypothetical protein
MNLPDIHAAHFLTTQIRGLNTRRFASVVTKQWLVYGKGAEGRWKNTDEVWSIIYKEVSKLKKQVLTIQIFALIILKQWPSLFQVIIKQQRSSEQREIAVNMVSVFLDETHCNLVDVSQKRYEGIYVPTKLHGVTSWAVIFTRKRNIWEGWISYFLAVHFFV